VNWNRIESSSSLTLRKIRASASFLHARAKAFLGSMSRAAFGSRPDPDRASTSSKWRIAPPAQVQVMISPCSSTPATTVNGRPLVLEVLSGDQGGEDQVDLVVALDQGLAQLAASGSELRLDRFDLRGRSGGNLHRGVTSVELG
jgi:hypothetical protein